MKNAKAEVACNIFNKSFANFRIRSIYHIYNLITSKLFDNINLVYHVN